MTTEPQALNLLLPATAAPQQAPPSNGATSRPKAASAAPLRWNACFELPEPQDFRENDLRELELTEDEINSLLRLACSAKYQAARDRWYNWKITRKPSPRAYTFHEMRAWFFYAAHKQLGRPFVVDEHNAAVLELLCLYFACDPEFETYADLAGRPYSLEKGLLLRGGIGCGKTTLLEIFASNPRQPYLVVPARDLESEYVRQGTQGEPAGGQDALLPYCRMVKLPVGTEELYNYRTHAGLALDDIGTENWQAKHYGVELAVVEHVISSRDDGVTAGTVPRHATHATTNVDFNDVQVGGKTFLGLETRYGARWRSRVRGLFNTIDFPDAAPDRRG